MAPKTAPKPKTAEAQPKAQKQGFEFDRPDHTWDPQVVELGTHRRPMVGPPQNYQHPHEQLANQVVKQTMKFGQWLGRQGKKEKEQFFARTVKPAHLEPDPADYDDSDEYNYAVSSYLANHDPDELASANHLDENPAHYPGISDHIKEIADRTQAGKNDFQDLYRSYKHTPHAPTSLFLKYLVHRVNNVQQYEDPKKGATLDKRFMDLHKLGGAAEKNGHVSLEHLHDWVQRHGIGLTKQLLDHREKLHRMIKRGVGLNVKDINGEPHVALTRGLNSDIMNKEHSLSSWADVPKTGFGKHMHHAWVPLKDIWYSYNLGPPRPSEGMGPENEFLVTHTAPRYEAKPEDVKRNRANFGDHSGIKDLEAERPDFFDDSNDEQLADRIRNFASEHRGAEILEHKNAGPKTVEAFREAFPLNNTYLKHPSTPPEHVVARTKENPALAPVAVMNPGLSTEDLNDLVERAPAPQLNALKNPKANQDTVRALWGRSNLPDWSQREILASPLVPHDILQSEIDKGNLSVLHNPNLTEQQTQAVIEKLPKNDVPTWIGRHGKIGAGTVDILLNKHDVNTSWPALEEAVTTNPNISNEALRKLAGEGFTSSLINRHIDLQPLPPDLQTEVIHHYQGTAFKHKGDVTGPYLRYMAGSPNLAPEAVRALALDRDWEVRGTLFRNKHIDPDLLESVWPKGVPFPEEEIKRHVDGAPLNIVFDPLNHLAVAIYKRKLYRDRRAKEHLIRPLPKKLKKAQDLEVPKTVRIPIANLHVLNRWGHPINPERLDYQIANGNSSPPIKVKLGTSFELNGGDYVHALDPQVEGEGWDNSSVQSDSSHPKYFLLDGHHRVRAAQQRGETHIDAHVSVPETPHYLSADKKQAYSRELSAEVAKLNHQDHQAEQATQQPNNPQDFIKGEANLVLGPQQLEPWEHDLAVQQLGHDDGAVKAMRAARVLASEGSNPDMERYRLSMIVHDGDVYRAALHSYGLTDSAENLKALRGLLDIGEFSKAVAPDPIHTVAAAVPEAIETAEEVQRAVESGNVKGIELMGKHSKGSQVARDPKTSHVWLLKKGSGKLSPAAGVKEEPASQSAREACFGYMARAVGLGRYVPRTDLLLINAQHWAAIALLPAGYQNLDKQNRKEPGLARKVLEPYRVSTVLFRWAILDGILGNTDAHGQNIMVGDGGSVALIDHGSAFAGKSFDPGHDSKSYIPYYLRVFSGVSFAGLTSEERFKLMPTLNTEQDRLLGEWIQGLDVPSIVATMERYHINPKPSIDRLRTILNGSGPWHKRITQMWAGLIPWISEEQS